MNKRAWLETETSRAELESNAEYRRLRAKIDRTESRLEKRMGEFSADDYERAFHDIPSAPVS